MKTNTTWANAKSWFAVYFTGVIRGRHQTRCANFLYYNDACIWAEKKRRNGMHVEIKEEHEVEWKDLI